MTILERIRKACANREHEKDSIDKLIYVAYMIGREEATKEVSDKYRAHIAEQKERADKSRYRNLCNYVVGDESYIYTSDYSGGVTETYGSDETKL